MLIVNLLFIVCIKQTVSSKLFTGELCFQNPKLAHEMINGRYPMCIAADYNQSEVIEYLKEKGADVDVSHYAHTVKLI